MSEYVFGYGSLAAGTARDAELPGYERWWGVALDNREAIPGYKRYAAADGSFPPVWVAFVDIRPAPGARVRGALLPVGDWAPLDRRERNYDRVRVEVPGAPGPVFAYRGSAAGRARAAAGRAAGALVVTRDYLELAGGGDPGLPVRELTRIDLG